VGTKTQTAKTDALVAANVDELGALERELMPYRAKLTRIDMLRAAIRTSYDNEDAAAGFEARGAKYVCMIGARAEKRVINVPALIKKVGLKFYSQLCAPTITALEAMCACDIVAAVVTSEQTGARSIRTFQRPE
jgi:hypothetical protein